MQKILAFAGSTSPQSINRQLVAGSVKMVRTFESRLIDFRDYPLPLYSVETELEGMPENAHQLRQLLQMHEALVIGVAEHNHSLTASFKNALDWISRSSDDYRLLKNKPIVLLSTSPGPSGGKMAALHAGQILSSLGGNVVATVSIPHFYQNVSTTGNHFQIRDVYLQQQLEASILELESQLSKTASS